VREKFVKDMPAQKSKVLETQILVIGSGLAGAVAAAKAVEEGFDVTLLSSGVGASNWAQGGIVYQGKNDPDQLAQDILSAGANENYKPAVRIVSQEGPHAVEHWLREKFHVDFDVETSGNLDLALEAAHSSKRILHVKDSTGSAIMKQVDLQLLSYKNIRRVEGVLVDLLLRHSNDERPETRFESTQVVGAYVFDPKTTEVYPIVAQAVILATGGFSQLYQHSTGPHTLRGDGIAAAHRVGARTMHLEYVQFHPTALFLSGKPRRLLTEALRGAGAKLLTFREKSFVDEMASRDVVSRAIHEEMLRSGESHVWLDLRSISKLEEKFPAICLMLKQENIDPLNDLVPVVPAAHYTIGGVWTDLEARTSVPGLFAAGEVACTGLHGANRLASTSLLEALVFGERAAKSAALWVRTQTPKFDFSARAWRSEAMPVDPALLQQDWQLLRQTLWNYVGLVRSERRLRRAERMLVELRTEVESFYKRSQLSEELIGLRHGVLVATLLLYAALRNPRSIGTHYLREDY